MPDDMTMTLRWFGEGLDSVTLTQIRQIPGVKGVVSALHRIPAGEVWPLEDILALKRTVESAGLALSGIESVNIHEDIKLGNERAPQRIKAYKQTLENLGKAGITLVCYNFMPIFDWTRTALAMPLPDGSLAMAYDQRLLDGVDPQQMFTRMEQASGGFLLPGWEPYRRAEIEALFAAYRGMTADTLRANLKTFLDAILPVCDRWGIRMAIHPDDPPWELFGLPRIVKNREDLLAIAKLNPSVNNGITLCTGSLGSSPKNDLPAIIRDPVLAPRIHFAHLRNIRFTGEGQFHESAHLSAEGSLDMLAIVRALKEVGFHGLMRPDHGRMLWNEQARPGYGLYDRALGAVYLSGLWEACSR